MTITRQPHINPVVTSGKIRIESITCLIRHDDVQVWYIDFASKYVDILSLGGNNEVTFTVGERTLHLDESAEHDWTTVHFDVPNDDESYWIIDATASRYSGYVYLIKIR